MFGTNQLKLGLFSLNADGGIAITKVPERWPAHWDEIAEVAGLADRAGFEFILPIARWKGFGGETDVRTHCFETLTFAAALGAITRRITLFATVHVPVVHPVFAAKALATVDQVSHGRAGLNIVCGWNQGEFDMFGHVQLKHDRRYAQGYEWYEVLRRILAGDEPFDYEGEFYSLKGVVGRPVPVQRPRPITMSAATSPAGRDFAARTSDMLFTSFAGPEKAAAQLDDIGARAAAAGRALLQVFTTCHVVCRETDAEAEAYYRHYAADYADEGAVDYHMAMTLRHREVLDPEALRRERVRYAAGIGSYPLVGSPERIAEGLALIHAAGFAGATVSFVNFRDELPFFIERVLPLLKQAGLRN